MRCARTGCELEATSLLVIYGVVVAPLCDDHEPEVRLHFSASGPVEYRALEHAPLLIDAREASDHGHDDDPGWLP